MAVVNALIDAVSSCQFPVAIASRVTTFHIAGLRIANSVVVWPESSTNGKQRLVANEIGLVPESARAQTEQFSRSINIGANLIANDELPAASHESMPTALPVMNANVLPSHRSSVIPYDYQP